ncbi:hypothetical protein L2E82_07296 [Cichorium intybus]|uniref:Uncharacterized protein n=1 Tax=Cichorium intybus TaxID=13427 RepID=A0ACB9G582_CICIN|nr:hypothetical protein L2E82_07296 [Cichorium intybus]
MAMTDWLQYTQSVVFGLVFFFLLAKLFSRIFSSRDENLRTTRANPSEEQLEAIPSESHWKSTEEVKRSDAEFLKKHISSSKKEPSMDQLKNVAATATAANRSSQKLPNDLKLQLYGLYKIATEGPCSVPQPSAIKMIARLKWNAWHKLGAIPTEEAIRKYIEIIIELHPTWADGFKSKKREGISNEPSSDNTRPTGPVFSTLIHEESANEFKNVDVTLKDNEGQTTLHYDAVCEREEIAALFVKKNDGSVGIKDNDGNYPFNLSDSNRP